MNTSAVSAGARVGTERAKFSYIHAAASDGRYVYTATAADNRNKKNFVISKALMSDWMLSGEFVPAADLKEGRHARRTLRDRHGL